MTDEPIKRPRSRPRKPRPEGEVIEKRPRGRPALGDKAKTINVTARLTKAEYELWKQLAKDKGITLVDFILQPLRRELKRKGIKP